MSHSAFSEKKMSSYPPDSCDFDDEEICSLKVGGLVLMLWKPMPRNRNFCSHGTDSGNHSTLGCIRIVLYYTGLRQHRSNSDACTP